MKNKTSFSARIDSKEYQQMQDNADHLDISMAKYGRLVIQKELKTKEVFKKLERFNKGI